MTQPPHPPAPSNPWRDRRAPWRNIPELSGLPDDRAAGVYREAMARRPPVWPLLGVLLGTVATFYAIVLLASWLAHALFGDTLVAGVFEAAAPPFALTLAGLALHALMRPTRRRAVRATLGTHCPACDYDLRAGPDPAGPRVPRCPECGANAPPDRRPWDCGNATKSVR